MKTKYFRDLWRVMYGYIWHFFNMHVKIKGMFLVSPKCELAFSHKSKVHIGSRVSVERGTLLAARDGAELNIGSGVYFNRNCMIVSRNSIVVGSGVTIGPNCCIYDHDHDMVERGNFKTAPIAIGDNAWIGANVVILKGVTIGEGAIISAGSVVVKNIPAYTVLIQKRDNEYRDYSHDF